MLILIIIKKLDTEYYIIYIVEVKLLCVEISHSFLIMLTDKKHCSILNNLEITTS